MDNSNVLVSSGLPYWFFFCLSSGLNAQAVSSASMDISKYTTSSSTPCFHCCSDMDDPKDQVWVCSYFIHRRRVATSAATSATTSVETSAATNCCKQAARGGLNKDNPNAMLGTMVV